MKNELYVIGNGFDIHHGIQSSYSRFKDYIKEHDGAIYDLVDEYLPVDDRWSDLEDCLAHIDVDSVIDNASQFLMSYGADDWRDSGHHDYQYEVNKIIEGLSSGLLSQFTDWINQLKIPIKCEVSDRIVNVSKDGVFLTFNYTNTLQGIYDIPEKNILFIHGKAESGDDLVLGHAWNPAIIPKLGEVSDPDSIDTRVMEGNELINDYFGQTFKDSKKIIAENLGFFNSLNSITVINVMGHSMSDVDMKYFLALINSVNTSKTKWRVSYYGASGLRDRQAAIDKLGINSSLVEYLELGSM